MPLESDLVQSDGERMAKLQDFKREIVRYARQGSRERCIDYLYSRMCKTHTTLMIPSPRLD